MLAQVKIDAIREYLQSEFPDFKIDNIEDFERVSQKFSVVNDSTIYVVKFERYFLENTPNVRLVLKNLELSKFMQQNEGKHTLVTKEGLTVL